MAFTNKVKKLIKSRSFLFTLLLTIVGLICIPLLVLQIFVIGQSTDKFEESNHEHFLSALEESSNTFASKEQILSQTALRISLNENIQKPLRNNADDYSWYEAAEALTGYSKEILHVESVGVYYVSTGYLLTNGYKFKLQNYCEKIEPADLAQAQKMETFFNEVDSIKYYATSDGRTLYVACPIALIKVGRNDGVAFFALDARALEESYRASVTLNSSFAVANAQGDFLIRGEHFTESLSETDISNLLSSGNSVFTVGTKDPLLVYKYTAPESDLIFLLCVDKDNFQDQLMDFVQLMHSALYVALVLIVVSLTVTIYITYLPIHRLLKKHTKNETEHELSSELERLDSAFSKLDQKAATQHDQLMEFILSELLFARPVKQELVRQYLPAERYRSFAVATSLCPTPTALQSRQLASMIAETTGYDIYVTNTPSRPHSVIICLSNHSIVPDALCSAITAAIGNIFGQEYPISMGEVVTTPGELRISYRSTMTTGLNTDQIEPGASAAEFTKEIQIFSQCVCIGDEAEALNHLENIRTLLNTKTVGEGQRRYYCFKLLDSFLASINSNKLQLSGHNTELLLTFTGAEHLFTLLRESIHQVCTQAADMERSVELQLQQKLLQYVNENFADTEMCLTAAADHMGTSTYAVSRLFKDLTGQGFNDYVTEKRLEYSRTLLINTQKSIAEVSAESGFDSANYFSTVFKQNCGMPPTKYRAIQKKNTSG